MLIAGATATGKSAYALDLAQRAGGILANADAMQVYRELRVLTARPGAQEEGLAPHRLYGHVGAAERYSVGRWLGDAEAVLREASAAGRPAIFVGGTGLYFSALLSGIAAVPPIPIEVRERWRQRAEGLSTAALHRLLAEADAGEAGRLRPSDRSRILRALEVLEGTGRPLSAWQREPARSVLPSGARIDRIVLDRPRAELYRRIEERLDGMAEAGAVEEARSLASLRLDPSLPAMKAIGVRQFLRHAAGELTLADALAAAKVETRNYAKRQLTWFRHRMADWSWVGG